MTPPIHGPKPPPPLPPLSARVPAPHEPEPADHLAACIGRVCGLFPRAAFGVAPHEMPRHGRVIGWLASDDRASELSRCLPLCDPYRARAGHPSGPPDDGLVVLVHTDDGYALLHWTELMAPAMAHPSHARFRSQRP